MIDVHMIPFDEHHSCECGADAAAWVDGICVCRACGLRSLRVAQVVASPHCGMRLIGVPGGPDHYAAYVTVLPGTYLCDIGGEEWSLMYSEEDYNAETICRGDFEYIMIVLDEAVERQLQHEAISALGGWFQNSKARRHPA